MAFYLDWVSGVILFFIYPLIVLFMIILGYAAKAKADKQFVSFQRLSITLLILYEELIH